MEKAARKPLPSEQALTPLWLWVPKFHLHGLFLT